MMLDTATCEANHRRFIKRVIESETVWYLQSAEGVAVAESYDYEDAEVLLFWSDRAYAGRAKIASFPDHQEESTTLFSFLYRWLPGMTGDGVLAGTNWTGELVGLEFQAFPLRKQIEAAMPDSLKAAYEAKYLELTKDS